MKIKKIILDQEEQEILDAIENDTIESVGIEAEEIAMLKKIATHTLAKTKTISIRISERDLFKLKALAAEEGMPYQTLISSTLHKKVKQHAQNCS